RALADIPARAGHVDVLRLGHPYADGLLTGADVPRPRDWPRLELSPPAARSDSDRGSRPGPAVPTAAERHPGRRRCQGTGSYICPTMTPSTARSSRSPPG